MSKLLLFCIVTCLFAFCWSKSIQTDRAHLLNKFHDTFSVLFSNSKYITGYCRYAGIYIKEGESSPSPLGTCNIITCENAEPTSMSVSALTCAAFPPRRGCSIGDHNYTKLFPDCCPREVC